MLSFENLIAKHGLPFHYYELPDEIGYSIGSYLQSEDGIYPDHFVLEVPKQKVVLFCIFTALSPNIPIDDLGNWNFYVANSEELSGYDVLPFETLARQFRAYKWNEVRYAIDSKLGRNND